MLPATDSIKLWDQRYLYVDLLEMVGHMFFFLEKSRIGDGVTFHKQMKLEFQNGMLDKLISTALKVKQWI